jgi:hypothetical protein
VSVWFVSGLTSLANGFMLRLAVACSRFFSIITPLTVSRGALCCFCCRRLWWHYCDLPSICGGVLKFGPTGVWPRPVLVLFRRADGLAPRWRISLRQWWYLVIFSTGVLVHRVRDLVSFWLVS